MCKVWLLESFKKVLQCPHVVPEGSDHTAINVLSFWTFLENFYRSTAVRRVTDDFYLELQIFAILLPIGKNDEMLEIQSERKKHREREQKKKEESIDQPILFD